MLYPLHDRLFNFLWKTILFHREKKDNGDPKNKKPINRLKKLFSIIFQIIYEIMKIIKVWIRDIINTNSEKNKQKHDVTTFLVIAW